MPKPLTPEQLAQLEAEALLRDPRPLGVFGLPNPLTPKEAAKVADQLAATELDPVKLAAAKVKAAKVMAEFEAAKVEPAKLAAAKVKAAKLDVEMGLLREAGLNLDRTKIADDGSREEEG
jgi:hypothetical protein